MNEFLEVGKETGGLDSTTKQPRKNGLPGTHAVRPVTTSGTVMTSSSPPWTSPDAGPKEARDQRETEPTPGPSEAVASIKIHNGCVAGR